MQDRREELEYGLDEHPLISPPLQADFEIGGDLAPVSHLSRVKSSPLELEQENP